MIKMTIKIATAECFTHGKIAQIIHSISMGYNQNIAGYDCSQFKSDKNLSLIGSVFVPTLSSVNDLLKIIPLKPTETINDIKVYSQEEDNEMSLMMAEAIKNITSSDIAIGTTAGIGKGAISIIYNDNKLILESSVYADLRKSDKDLILKRQESGIKITMTELEKIINSF